MSESEQTVFVVDDDDAVRGSLRMLLNSVGLKSALFPSAAAFLAEVSGAQGGCVLLDIRMPGMSGLQLFEQMCAKGMRLPVIFITGHGDVPMAVRAIKKGAFDFLQKPFNDQDLLDRVQAALGEDIARRNSDVEQQSLRERRDRLTPREREIMERVVAGQANKVIAIELGLSERTVELHRAHVMEKMEVRSLAELVAANLGLK
ncbi:MAG: Response regulator protein TmoT [Gammaproteobacteria bacterium]|nr:Response regulator protein TmoT [Gammaproteobacteria bacterium]